MYDKIYLFKRLGIEFKAIIHNVHGNKFQENFKFEYYCVIKPLFIDIQEKSLQIVS